MGPKCNIDEIEGEAIFARMRPNLDYDEEAQFLKKFSAYCFYDTWGTKNHRECYCTVCDQYFSAYKDEEPSFFNCKHNDYTICPSCGEEVQLKCMGRMRDGASLKETSAAAFIRPATDGAIYISAGIGYREFDLSAGECRPFLEYVEKARYYLAPGKVKGWKRSIHSYYARCVFGCGEWQKMARIREPFQSNYLFGHDNDYWLFGTEYLGTSGLKYSSIEEWYHDETGDWLCECDNSVKLCISYLANYAMRPQMEMAVKMGLPELCTDLCVGKANGNDINWKAKKPWDFLKLSKEDTKAFLLAPDLGLLRALHIARKEGFIASVDELARACSAVGTFGFDGLISCARRCGVPLECALNYFTAHGRGAVGIWSDYLDMCAKLGYDMSRRDVCMPKNLRERHDAAADALRVEEDKKAFAHYKKRYKALCDKYEFEMDGYRIIVPMSSAEIVREGRTLHHCVGGYAARHIKGDCTILFFRRERKPGTSFVTIEMKGLNGDEIRQMHGYQNEGYKGAVSPLNKYQQIIDTWLDWVRGGSKRDGSGKPILKKEAKIA